MYHVESTGITILILYSISYLFCRLGYYTSSFHKKLWNSVLAIAFLLSAMAGVFMALQISFKWNIPNVKTILKWHVEFGIAMAFTGLIHFFLHLSYFLKILSGNKNQEPQKVQAETLSLSLNDLALNLFITGFVS
jgi:hypothetical protein